MDSRLLEIGGSAAFVFTTTYVVITSSRALWDVLDEWTGAYTGEPVLIVLMAVACLASAGVFVRFTGVRTPNLAAGGIVVYVLWFLYLETTAGPFDSPVHVYLGVFFLCAFVAGAWVVE